MDMDLHSYIKQSMSIDTETIRYILKGILEGISYIHKNNFFHRDLKPHNILISKGSDNSVKDVRISDFG